MAFIEARHGIGLMFRDTPEYYTSVLNKWLVQAKGKKANRKTESSAATNRYEVREAGPEEWLAPERRQLYEAEKAAGLKPKRPALQFCAKIYAFTLQPVSGKIELKFVCICGNKWDTTD